MAADEPRAIARHHHRSVRHAYIETHTAVFALMHIARHVSEKRREIDLVTRDRKFVRFQLTKLAHLRDQCADPLAGAFGLLQHFFLLLGERPAMLLQHHSEIAAHDGDGCPKLMHGERESSRKTVGFDGRLRGLTLPQRPSRDNLGRGIEGLYNYRMFIRRPPDLRFSDITPKSLYLRRREFLQTAAGAALGAAAATLAPQLTAHVNAAPQREGTGHGAKLPNVVKSPLSTTGEKINSWDEITSYNNFYEFGPVQGRSERERVAPEAAALDDHR